MGWRGTPIARASVAANESSAGAKAGTTGLYPRRRFPFDPSPWLHFDRVILWGANHYAQRLPVGTTLIWLKKDDHLFGSFPERCRDWMAKGRLWVYAFRKQFLPLSRMAENDGLQAAHLTQKPLALMAWCIERAGRPALTLDPFMGSGTTGVAAMQMGLSFIGIEREPGHSTSPAAESKTPSARARCRRQVTRRP